MPNKMTNEWVSKVIRFSKSHRVSYVPSVSSTRRLNLRPSSSSQLSKNIKANSRYPIPKPKLQPPSSKFSFILTKFLTQS